MNPVYWIVIAFICNLMTLGLTFWLWRMILRFEKIQDETVWEELQKRWIESASKSPGTPPPFMTRPTILDDPSVVSNAKKIFEKIEENREQIRERVKDMQDGNIEIGNWLGESRIEPKIQENGINTGKIIDHGIYAHQIASGTPRMCD